MARARKVTVNSSDEETGKDPKLQQALDRFRVAAKAEDSQRLREIEDLRFARGTRENDQWTDDVLALRKGGNLGASVIAQRPHLTINKLKQPIQQLENQQKSARLEPKISPKGSLAAAHTAEMLQGLYRNISVESRASIARNWAYSRAVKCGRGFYRVNKRYANDGDAEDASFADQDITIERILNQHSVILDPFAQEPDWSDGEYAFIVSDMPWERYKRVYPQSKLAHYTEQDLQAIGNDLPGWVGQKDDAKVIRIAEYWYLEQKNRRRKELADVSRELQDRVVKWSVINAIEFVEQPQEWDGQYIPIIPVIASEDNINGERSWEGIVRPAIDAQRTYNYMRSAEVETIALAPKTPFIMAEGQDEGYEQEWAAANVRNFSTLKYRPVDLKGQPVPPPARQVLEPPIQAIAQSVAQANDDIQATTGKFDPSLGKLKREASGTALKALQQQDDLGNSGFLDSLASISMTHEAKVILDLIPHVYDRPGRIVRLLGLDGSDEWAMVNQPFVLDQNGQPQPAHAGAADSITHNLKDGRYSCVVDIGKGYTTARKEAADILGQVIQSEPQLLTIFGDLWAKNLDIPEAGEMSERFKKLLPPALQDDKQNPMAGLPPQAQQMIQQLQAQVQQLQQAASQNMAKIQVAQIQTQSAQQIAQLKAQSDQQKAMMQAQTEGMKQQAETGRQVMEHRADFQQAQADRQHEAQQSQLEIAANQQSQQMQQQHDAHEAQMGRQHEAQQGAVARQHESQQAGMTRAHEAASAHVGYAHESASNRVGLAHEKDMAQTSHKQQKELVRMQPKPEGKKAK